MNNTRYNFQEKKGAFQTYKTTIYRPHTFELKSISKYQLLFHCESLENIWSFILYLEAGETELITTCVVPFVIAEFGQKCLEAASTLKYEPLNSCIIVQSVSNTCTVIKDEKIVSNQDGGLKVPFFDL